MTEGFVRVGVGDRRENRKERRATKVEPGAGHAALNFCKIL